MPEINYLEQSEPWFPLTIEKKGTQKRLDPVEANCVYH